MKTIPYHPVANLFPLMTTEEFDALCADIAEHGLLNPIWLWQGKIIDGRNRYRACLKTGVEPLYYEWNGTGSLVSFVVGLNLRRRNLTAGQRAVLASKIRPLLLKESRERKLGNLRNPAEILDGAEMRSRSDNGDGGGGKSSDKAGKLAEVSARTVESFERVKKDADPSVLKAVEAGTVSVSAAEGIIGLSREDQRRVMDRIESGKAKTIREATEQLFPEDDGPRPIPCPHCRGLIRREWLLRKLA